MDTKPKLRPGDLLQLMFDNKPLGPPRKTTVFALKDINRGSHTLAAKIVDSKGNVLATSDTITIFMQQPRVGMGANAP